MAGIVIMKIMNKYRFKVDMRADNQEQLSNLEKNSMRVLVKPNVKSKVESILQNLSYMASYFVRMLLDIEGTKLIYSAWFIICGTLTSCSV